MASSSKLFIKLLPTSTYNTQFSLIDGSDLHRTNEKLSPLSETSLDIPHLIDKQEEPTLVPSISLFLASIYCNGHLKPLPLQLRETSLLLPTSYLPRELWDRVADFLPLDYSICVSTHSSLLKINNSSFTHASEYGHLNVLKFITKNLPNMSLSCIHQDFSEFMDLASKNGHLHVVKFLNSMGRKSTRNAMNSASSNGHLAIVEFLYSAGKKCTVKAMDLASSNGHLDVVKFLHSVEKKCTVKAMDLACGNGHLHIVEFLHSIGKKCTKKAIGLAIVNGHLDVVRFLHSIGKKCTLRAMDFAIRNGDLDIVKFLHSIGEVCTYNAMEIAFVNSHFDVVQFLQLNRKIISTKGSHYQ